MFAILPCLWLRTLQCFENIGTCLLRHWFRLHEAPSGPLGWYQPRLGQAARAIEDTETKSAEDLLVLRLWATNRRSSQLKGMRIA